MNEEELKQASEKSTWETALKDVEQATWEGIFEQVAITITEFYSW